MENHSFTAFPFSFPSFQSFTYCPPVLVTSPRRGMMMLFLILSKAGKP